MNLPRIIGHRGARNAAPENTLAGLRAAADAGAEWVEVDVRLTGDDRPVLLHDPDLDRTTTGRGPLADTDLAAVRELDAGSWFSTAFDGEPVPELETALREFDRLGLGVNLELKAEPGRESRLVDAVAAALTENPVAGGVLLSSFDRGTVAACRRRLPKIHRGLIAEKLSDDEIDFARAQCCLALCVGAESLQFHRIPLLRSSGFAVIAWTVNAADKARSLLDAGVRSVITDDPALLLAYCGTGE